ncbi:hypothetical protein [Amycolatopsis sp. MtRt-6]|uniref:hypothetical protein n=1 Tax=Amycolatopsis sp. MtRt-6 TaxID=2792782 RepID=UPI001A8C50AD|nr:hypothetical protein [Amycolatopsis sp. MtRt-6]
MEPWLIIVIVVAAFLLIAFGTKMIHRISVRSDGENSELTAEAHGGSAPSSRCVIL